MSRHLGELVDPRTGIVRSVFRVPKSREEPELPVVCQSLLASFDFRKAEPSERIASGKGPTEAAARTGAIAEALERYCACQPDPSRLRAARAADLPACVPPDAFVLYSERQRALGAIAYPRPQADQVLSWVEAQRVCGGAPAYVPASLVYMTIAGQGGTERFAAPTSNGLAAGPDLDGAVLSGITELIERDAFVIFWMNRLPARRLDVSAGDAIASGIARHYRRFGIETIALDITTDIGVPVVMALTVDRSGTFPAVVVGLGCDLDPSAAVARAVMEVAQVRAGAVARYRAEPRRLPATYREIRTLEDHAAFAAQPGNLREFDFLLDERLEHGSGGPAAAGIGRGPAESGAAEAGDARELLRVCNERLQAAGIDAFLVDLTLPDLEPFPVRVVRCLAPGLQPIQFGWGEERLGGRRLFEVPRRLGLRRRDAVEDELNPCPHPLA